MRSQLIAVAISTTLSLVALWFTVAFLFREYLVDSFRQQMFGLRDELFDDARRGLMQFDHPAYGILRSTMNGFIRFGHRLNALQFLVFAVALPRTPATVEALTSFERRWAIATDEMVPAERERATLYRSRMNVLVLRHIVLASPLLMVTLVLPLLVLILARLGVGWIARLCSSPFNRIDSAALTYGES